MLLRVPEHAGASWSALGVRSGEIATALPDVKACCTHGAAHGLASCKL